MLDRAPGPAARLVAEIPAPLPVAALLAGRPVAEAAALLPRLFSLCRAAQGAAARLALGLPAEDGAMAAVTREVRRDHLMKLCVTWPGFFGGPPAPLPADWASDGRTVAAAVFGPAGAPPATLADFRSWLASGHGAGPVLSRIAGAFAPGEAVTPALPAVDEASAFDRTAAVENSVAGRAAAHPLMRALEAEGGRGPLWRAAARAVDLDAALTGRLPAPRAPAPGQALVPAARGLYAVAARVEGGRVAAIARVTPTDHLTAPGGALRTALAALPADRAALAPLLLDILDPCAPVAVREVRDA